MEKNKFYKGFFNRHGQLYKIAAIMLTISIVVAQASMSGSLFNANANDANSPRIKYHGKDIAEKQRITEDAELTAEYRFYADKSELSGKTEAVAIPKYLKAADGVYAVNDMNSGRQLGTVTVRNGEAVAQYSNLVVPVEGADVPEKNTTPSEDETDKKAEEAPAKEESAEAEGSEEESAEAESSEEESAEAESSGEESAEAEVSEEEATDVENELVEEEASEDELAEEAEEVESADTAEADVKTPVEEAPEAETEAPVEEAPEAETTEIVPEGSTEEVTAPADILSGLFAPMVAHAADVSEQVTVTFEIPCQFDREGLPNADKEGIIHISLTSNGRNVPVELTRTEKAGIAAASNVLRAAGTFASYFSISDLILKKGSDVIVDKTPPTSLSFQDAMTVQYNFEITMEQMNQLAAAFGAADANLTLELPAGLVWSQNQSVALEYNNGSGMVKYGEVSTQEGGAIANITIYKSFWEDDSFAMTNAYFTQSVKLDKAEIGTDTEYDLDLEGDIVTVGISDNVNIPHELKKQGIFDETNQVFHWTVNYTAGSDVTGLYRFMDELGSGHIYKSGTFLVNGTADSSVSYNSTTNVLEYDFGNIAAEQDIVLKYDTVLSDDAFTDANRGTATSVENYAQLWDDSSNTKLAEAKAGVTASAYNKKDWIQKDGEPIGDGRRIKWTIVINTNDRNLENLILHDFVPNGLALDESTIVVTPQPENGVGTAIGTPGTGGTEWVIPLLKGADPYAPKYTVTYETEVTDDDLFEDPTIDKDYENKAWLTFDWRNYDGSGIFDNYTSPEVVEIVAPPTNLIEKIVDDYDRDTHIITWRTTINPHSVYLLAGALLKDNLKADAAKSMTYVPNSLNSIGDIVQFNSDNNGNLEFELTTDITTPHSFTFQTYADDINHYGIGGNSLVTTKYYNTITIDGYVRPTVGNDIAVTDAATGEANVISQVLRKEHAGYDYNTYKSKWRITVNQNNMPMDDVVLADVVEAHQSYVAGSLKVLSSGDGLTATDIDVSYNQNAGDLEFAVGQISKQLILEYETILDVDEHPDFKTSTAVTIRNAVTLKRDGNTAPQVTADAAKRIDNVLLRKAGARGTGDRNGVLAYSVGINPAGLDMTGLKLNDTWAPKGQKLVLDPDSVKLYVATVDSVGRSFKTAVEATGWKLINKPAEDGFQIDLPDTKQALVLEYDCYIIDPEVVTFSNDISFDSSEFTVGDTSTDVGGAGGSSGGIITPSPKMARIRLIDEVCSDTLIKLANITFQIYQGDELIGEKTTDSDGFLEFYPIAIDKEYRLVMVSDTPGYFSQTVVDSSSPNEVPLEDFVIKPTVGGENGIYEIIVKNHLPATINLEDIDINDPNIKLDDVTFRLYDGTTLVDEQTTDENGKLSFKDVPPLKDYQIVMVESTQKSGYFDPIIFGPNGENSGGTELDRFPITIGEEPEYNVVVKNLRKAAIHITSVDKDDPTWYLDGVEYELYDEDNKLIGTGTTDANGELLFDEIEFNNIDGERTYHIVEKKGKPGYRNPVVLSEESNNFDPPKALTTFTIKPTDSRTNNIFEVVIASELIKSDVSFKTINDFDHLLPNAKYKVTGTVRGKNYEVEGVTDKDGVITFPNVPMGDFKITEIKTVDYHEISTEDLDLEVDEDGKVSLTKKDKDGNTIDVDTVVNVSMKGDITVVVFLENTNEPIANVDFQLRDALTGKLIPGYTATSDQNGRIRFNDLPITGKYIIEEVESNSGYDVSNPLTVSFADKDGKLPPVDSTGALINPDPLIDVDWPKVITTVPNVPDPTPNPPVEPEDPVVPEDPEPEDEESESEGDDTENEEPADDPAIDNENINQPSTQDNTRPVVNANNQNSNKLPKTGNNQSIPIFLFAGGLLFLVAGGIGYRRKIKK